MRKEIIFLYFVSLILINFTIIDNIIILFKKKKVKKTIGSIFDIEFLLPEGMHINSKWAIISYYINNREYISNNRIQVPMNSKIGDKVTIKFYKDKPEILYNHSSKWSIIAIIV